MNEPHPVPASNEDDAYLCRALTTLTCRERVAFLEIANDLSNVEIAERIGVQPKSVE